MEKDFEKVRESLAHEVEASSLLHKSCEHKWYEYLGNPIDVKYSSRVMEFKAGMCFGLKPAYNGYSLETDVMQEGPIPINFKDGYVLTKLSRELSKREARFTKTVT